jgi:hypothetical protein
MNERTPSIFLFHSKVESMPISVEFSFLASYIAWNFTIMISANVAHICTQDTKHNI